MDDQLQLEPAGAHDRREIEPNTDTTDSILAGGGGHLEAADRPNWLMVRPGRVGITVD